MSIKRVSKLLVKNRSYVSEDKISQFLESSRPHILHQDLSRAYQELASDEEREQEATAWSEGLIGDANNTKQ